MSKQQETGHAHVLSSFVIGAAVGALGGVMWSAAGGAGEPGTSGCLDVGDLGRIHLSFTGGGGGGSVGATSRLIAEGEFGGVVGFSGRFGESEWQPNACSEKEILGFGATGGLDLGRVSFSEWDWGGGCEEESADSPRGVLEFRCEFLICLLPALTVGLGLDSSDSSELSADSAFLIIFESDPGPSGGLRRGLGELETASAFFSSTDGLIVLSVCLPWTSLEEIRGVFSSDGLLLREETLAGGCLYWRSFSSFPWRPSLFSLCNKKESVFNRVHALQKSK